MRIKLLSVLILLSIFLFISCCKTTSVLLIKSLPFSEVEVFIDGGGVTTPYLLSGQENEMKEISVEPVHLLDTCSWIEGVDTKAIFLEWSGLVSSSATTVELEIKNGSELIAILDFENRLEYVENFGEEDISRDDLSGWFSAGECIELTAESYEGYSFAGWEVQTEKMLETGLSSTPLIVITMETPVLLRAVYNEEGEI